jgi:hypothetical protein
VAGVEPGLVGQGAEELGLDVVEEVRKLSASPRVLPTPPGKSESPVNRCGWPEPSSNTRAIEPGVWPVSRITRSEQDPTGMVSPSSTLR